VENQKKLDVEPQHIVPGRAGVFEKKADLDLQSQPECLDSLALVDQSNFRKQYRGI
jgi:hypothetical protein